MLLITRKLAQNFFDYLLIDFWRKQCVFDQLEGKSLILQISALPTPDLTNEKFPNNILAF